MLILPTLFRALPAPLINAPHDDTAWLAVADVHVAIRLCLVQRDRGLTERRREKRNGADDADGDVALVDRWAARLGLRGWYRWERLDTLPPTEAAISS